MNIKFREKALMAYETMPPKKKSKVDKIIEQLNIHGLQGLKVNKIKKYSQYKNTWMIRIDERVRLLLSQEDQNFLIIDIIDRQKLSCL